MGFFTTAAVLSLAATSALAEDGLNSRAKSVGKKYFGSATENGALSESAYVRILSNTSDFGQITPANSMKVR
jgi:endo-1,4-beta-xylanase